MPFLSPITDHVLDVIPSELFHSGDKLLNVVYQLARDNAVDQVVDHLGDAGDGVPDRSKKAVDDPARECDHVTSALNYRPQSFDRYGYRVSHTGKRHASYGHGSDHAGAE